MERWDFSKFRKTMHPRDEGEEDTSTRRHMWEYTKVQWYRLRVAIARIGRSQTLPTVNLSNQDLILDRESSPEPIYSLQERFKNFIYAVRDVPSQIRAFRDRKSRPNEAQTISTTALSAKTGHIGRPGHTPRSQSDLLARAATQDAVDPRQLDEFVGKLRNLAEKQSGVHQNGERVKHMQFSPCGKWLVVCYQFSCIVYRVEVSDVA